MVMRYSFCALGKVPKFVVLTLCSYSYQRVQCKPKGAFDGICDMGPRSIDVSFEYTYELKGCGINLVAI